MLKKQMMSLKLEDPRMITPIQQDVMGMELHENKCYAAVSTASGPGKDPRKITPLQQDVQGLELHVSQCYEATSITSAPGIFSQENNKAYLRNLSCKQV